MDATALGVVKIIDVPKEHPAFPYSRFKVTASGSSEEFHVLVFNLASY
jgi:hypothetical protein